MGWRDDIFCKHHPDTMHHRWCWDKGGYCIDCGKTTEQMQTLGYTITVGPGGAAIIEKTDPDAKAPGMRGVVVDVSTPEGLAELRRWGQQYADVTKEQVLPLLKQATPEERVAKLAYEHMRSKFLAAEVPECSWENQNEAVRRDWIDMAHEVFTSEREGLAAMLRDCVAAPLGEQLAALIRSGGGCGQRFDPAMEEQQQLLELVGRLTHELQRAQGALAEEREACAKRAGEWSDNYRPTYPENADVGQAARFVFKTTCQHIAAAIRARSSSTP